MPTPTFSQDWISGSWPIWERYLPPAGPDPLAILEIGCFEGRSTCYFLERYPDDYIVVIDTFEGGTDHKQMGLDFSATEQRFRSNIALVDQRKNGFERTAIYKGSSDCQLSYLRNGSLERFNIALIDGSHLAHDVLSDIVLTWPLLAPGALLILDDYGWGRDRSMVQTPKPAINAFLACYFGQYELLERDYQVLVRKL